MVIGDLTTQAAKRYPNKKAVVFKGTSQTFAKFNSQVNQLANAFFGLGLRPGQKVAILSYNSPDMLATLFASAKAGLIFVPVNFRMAPPEMKFVLNDAEVELFLVAEEFEQTVAEFKDELTVPRVMNMEDDFAKLMESAGAEEPGVAVDPQDIFAIFYTSGTTGGPKGVVLSHGNFLSAIVNNVIAYKLGPTDVGFHLMPFYHTMSASMALCQFYVSGTSVVTQNLDPDLFWQLVQEEQVTHCTLVFTALNDILKAYKDKGYSKGSFRYFSIGGQTTPTEVLRDTIQTLGPGSVFVVYGLTEASPLLTYLPPEEVVLEGERSRLLASIGKELFSCNVRVVDENDRDVGPGQLGEIIASGPNIMREYWKRPKDTAKTLRGGWLRTGDVGQIDNEGYIYVIDRKKDLIISGGENISPHEVEEVLYKHPAVGECAVIGVPDQRWGEQVKGIVVLKNGVETTEGELIDVCLANLAKYKVPRSITFVDALPRDPVGKIQKRILREQFAHSGT